MPGLPVEVDDLEVVHAAVVRGGFTVEYGPVDEPWGVRRFFVCDPAGTLVNIVIHAGSSGDDACLLSEGVDIEKFVPQA